MERLNPGDRVRIRSGPGTGITGTVKKASETILNSYLVDFDLKKSKWPAHVRAELIEKIDTEPKPKPKPKMATKTKEQPDTAARAPQVLSIPKADLRTTNANPRKHFDENSLRELADSIREKGLIQPITVTPDSYHGKYVIVCGERRYRACMMLDEVKEMVAVVRYDLSESEALELAITENLQRVDVSPLEESDSFQALLKFHTPEDIAVLLGRTEKFVRQRIRLQNLIPVFRRMLESELISIKIAFKISGYEKETQEDVFKGYLATYNKSEESIFEPGKYGRHQLDHIDIWSHRNGTDLKRASFPLDDATLTDAGACTKCPFNTANALRLFEENSEPRCMKQSCFQSKTVAFLTREARKAVEIGMPLIKNSYGPIQDVTKAALEAVGNARLFTTNDVEIIYNAPTIQTLEEWWDDCYNEYYPENEMPDETPDWDSLTARDKERFREDYMAYRKQAKERVEEWEKENSEGVYEGLVVDGYDGDLAEKVKFRYKSGAAPAVLEGDHEQITKLTQKEQRAKEIDREKITTAAKQALMEKWVERKGTLSERDEVIALIMTVYGLSNDMTSTMIAREAGLDDRYDWQRLVLYARLQGLDDMTLFSIANTACRCLILDKLYTVSTLDGNKYGQSKALIALANSQAAEAYKTAALEIREKAIKRQQAYEAKLAEARKGGDK